MALLPPRRFSLLLLVTGLLAVAVAVIWFVATPSEPPPPPVPSAGDPIVRQEIEKARTKVLREPTAEAWGELGKRFRAHAHVPESNVCFLRAATLAPTDSRWAYLLGTDALLHEPTDALPLLRRAATLGHPDAEYRAAARLRLAEALLEQQQLDEAERLFREEQQRDPASARAAYGLALVAAAHDDIRTAVSYLTPLASNPFARKKSSAQLAVLSRRLGDADAAARYQTQAVRAPEDLPWPDPYITEVMRVEAGRHSRMTRATELEAQGRVREAILVLNEVVRDYPDERSYVALGITLAKAGDYPAAEEMLRATLRLMPEHIQGNYFLGVVLFFRAQGLWSGGDAERERARTLLREATVKLDRATDAKPDHALAWYYRGRCLRYLGDRKAAIDCFRHAVLSRPETPDPILHLAETLAEAGKKEEAVAVLRSALESHTGHAPQLKEALERLRKEG